MTVNIKEVAEYVAAKNGISKKAAEAIVQDTIDYIRDSLFTGEVIVLHKFGKFEVDLRAARQGRNPKTGEQLAIPAKRVVKFKPAKELRDLLA